MKAKATKKTGRKVVGKGRLVKKISPRKKRGSRYA